MTQHRDHRVTPENGVSLSALVVKTNAVRARYGARNRSSQWFLLFLSRHPEFAPTYESPAGVERIRRDWTPAGAQAWLAFHENELLEKKRAGQQLEDARRAAAAPVPVNGDQPELPLVPEKTKDLFATLRRHREAERLEHEAIIKAVTALVTRFDELCK
jgi:hypothetical protein